MTSACNLHYATSSWLNNNEPRRESKMSSTRGMKAAATGAVVTGLSVWPIIISTFVAGPIGLLISEELLWQQLLQHQL